MCIYCDTKDDLSLLSVHEKHNSACNNNNEYQATSYDKND